MFGKQTKMALCLTALAGMLIVPAWLTADVCLAAYAETETVVEIQPLEQPFVLETDCGVFTLTGTVRAVFHTTVTNGRVVVQSSVGPHDVLVLDQDGNEYIATGRNNQNFQFELGVGHRQHVASSIHIIGRGNLPNLIGQITGTAEFDADGNLIDLVFRVNRLDCVS